MIAAISPSTSSIISRISFSHDFSRKIAIPVSPFLSPFIALKHLIGVPSRNEGGNIPLYKLKILDNLIERLARHNSQAAPAARPDEITAGNIDSIITDLSRQVKNISQELKPFVNGLSQELGSILNILI